MTLRARKTATAGRRFPARGSGLHLLAAALLLAGCAPGRPIDPLAQARAMAAQPAAPAAEEFPAIEMARWKEGVFPNLENLRLVSRGMGKDQIRHLLGWPHFDEGLWGARDWNYIFHLRTGKATEFITCQYMVRFDDSMLSTGAFWKGSECADLLRPAAKVAMTEAPTKPVVVVQPLPSPAPTPLPPKKISLGTDGLFRFGGGALSDLQPQGRQKVEQLAQEIRRNFRTIQSISITGHTDRLGSTAYNDALSIRRANTVRDLLVNAGIDEALLRASGAGKSQPVVDCPGTKKTPSLVACLQPNRRVEVEVRGAA
ncbi:outer membrane protein assembly factor BamE [Variovorax defluvii]|uniref:Outer membrane protein assembly factor BamE n=1 Tax=Variovorax defluvii TaxID=913761 RepID=A0ABP8I2W4_9BURK